MGPKLLNGYIKCTRSSIVNKIEKHAYSLWMEETKKPMYNLLGEDKCCEWKQNIYRIENVRD